MSRSAARQRAAMPMAFGAEIGTASQAWWGGCRARCGASRQARMHASTAVVPLQSMVGSIQLTEPLCGLVLRQLHSTTAITGRPWRDRWRPLPWHMQPMAPPSLGHPTLSRQALAGWQDREMPRGAPKVDGHIAPRPCTCRRLLENIVQPASDQAQPRPLPCPMQGCPAGCLAC